MDGNTGHYTVLARRFRPQAFGEVVGQEHIAKALRNAIAGGRVAHAYLFTGARGVGKTSMARILAKTLNCPNTQQDGNPCQTCDICEGISSGNDVDVLEIDGASNRGIDDIRTLRANVNVKSMRSEYKIYIIDEVHMLTKEAFNALLKTLEEPPPNVKFVFCTTEPNKLPDTILSRCQRFDFGIIDTSDISERLRTIAEAEGFEVKPEAIELIARRAAGSMRDSQSLFDQLLAFGEEHITAADVHRLLGTAGDDRLIEIAEALVEHQVGVVLSLLDETISAGVQLSELIDQLLAYLRDLMVISAGAEKVPLLAVSSENRGQLRQQSEKWGLKTIVAGLQILTETKSRMFRASFARALAEVGLVRIATLEDLESLDQVIQEIRQGGLSSGSVGAAKRTQTLSKPTSSRQVVQEPGPQHAGSLAPKSSINSENLPPKTTAEADPATWKEVVQVELRQGTERAVWAQVLSHIDDMLKDHIQAVSSVAISGPNRLDLAFPKSYHFSKQFCERPEITGRIEKLAEKVTGQPIRISFRIVPDEESEAPAKPEPSRSASRAANTEVVDDEFVEKAKSIFNGTIVKVEGVASPSPQEE